MRIQGIAAGLIVGLAIGGCAPQNVKPVRPDEQIDISAIEGQWEGRSKRWGERNKLRIYTDDDARAVAYYCWGGWCRSTKNYMLKNPKITPTTVEFGLGRARVIYTLEGEVLKASFNSPGTHWDHNHAQDDSRRGCATLDGPTAPLAGSTLSNLLPRQS